MEEKKNKKKKMIIILLVVLLVGVGIGFGVSKITSGSDRDLDIEENVSDDSDNDEKNQTEKEDSVDEPEVVVPNEEERKFEDTVTFSTISTENNTAAFSNENAKTRLVRWVNGASNISDGHESSLDFFQKGVSSKDLTKHIKLLITYNTIYMDRKNLQYNYWDKPYYLKESDIINMESFGKKGNDWINEGADIIKISVFNSFYKGLFNENVSYTIKDLDFGCPRPVGLDKTQDRIYLFHRCGGTSDYDYPNKITSFTSDNNYYYLHEEIYYKRRSNNKIEKTFKYLWKFDKNLNFVSNVKE